ncbi:unnamed protein product [Notodromas monacha]|uniref:Uncharacterized protein n=1 Tax=Notodromas monacha TaxID=399045 RepID=A0A7R9BZ63_9CRUS|nr:unnamed protein product [Notodromas monacha]CAG0923236.1 unnamed protein product [Notodromas monacha]
MADDIEESLPSADDAEIDFDKVEFTSAAGLATEKSPGLWDKAFLGLRIAARVLGVFVCLYFFICSLELLAAGFRVLGGRTTTELLRSSMLSNPVVGLMVGVLVTVIVQSSSTTTSMVVAMVNAQIVSLPVAIPIIMGANIGTTVTNSLVAFGQAQESSEFELAFAAASIHDFFNWLCVVVQLPVEVLARPLEISTGHMVGWISRDESAKPTFAPLHTITAPVINSIMQVNKTFLDPTIDFNNTDPSKISARKDCSVPGAKCSPSSYLFESRSLSDSAAGSLLVMFAMGLMCGMLILMVKLLHSLLRGEIEATVNKVINAEFPYPFKWLSGYVAILAGAVMTFLVQSSSVFTSSLTPLAGLGLITLERVYPMTLGSNIGTTSTALMAAVSTDNPDTFQITLQAALCHFMFNLIGVLLFYVLPPMRIPIPIARYLGRVVGKYPWFSLFYILSSFILLPLLVFILSSISVWLLITVCILTALLVCFLLVVNKLQEIRPQSLPKFLQTWEFLPIWLRSLEPYDRVAKKVIQFFSKCRRTKRNQTPEETPSPSTAPVYLEASPNTQQSNEQKQD